MGDSGTGNLFITDGGSVKNNYAVIGYNSGATGHATVDGVGSTWTGGFPFYVGYTGSGRTGTLSISDGGFVHASASSSPLTVYSGSTLTIDVGFGSLLELATTGAGGLTNNGTVRLVAGAGAAAGTYTPIEYGTMSGSGALQTLGGVWNSTAHTVTVHSAATATGAGGASAIISSLASTQRAFITDTATGKSVGAGFQAGSGSLTSTASTIGSGSELSSLQSDLSAGQGVLSAWTLAAPQVTPRATPSTSHFSRARAKVC